MAPNPRHHRIDYIEFAVTDVAAAKAFYAAAFDWAFIDYAPTYAGIIGDVHEMGGLCAHDEPVQRGTGVLAVVYSEDLEATEGRVVAAGAKISTPVFSFPGGRRFHFVDPDGNELAVWTQDA